ECRWWLTLRRSHLQPGVMHERDVRSLGAAMLERDHVVPAQVGVPPAGATGRVSDARNDRRPERLDALRASLGSNRDRRAYMRMPGSAFVPSLRTPSSASGSRPSARRIVGATW